MFLAVLVILIVLAGYCWGLYHYQAAEKALAAYAFDQASGHLNRCSWIWPRSAAVAALAAQAARRRDDYDQAVHYLADWERLGGNPQAIQLERDSLRAQQGDLDGIEESLRASAGNPEHALLILEALCKGYLRSYRVLEALPRLDRLLAFEPKHVPALVLRGQAFAMLHQPDKALGDFQKALQLASSCREARLGLAKTLYELGRAWEAAGHFDKLRQEPLDPEVLLGLARCRHDLHELTEAGQLLDTLLAGHPDHLAGLRERAEVSFRQGNVDDAEKHLRRLVSLTPWDREVHRLLIWCLRKQGKKQQADIFSQRLEDVEAETIRLNKLIAQAIQAPRDAALRRQIGLSFIKAGRDAEGLPWIFTALKIDPEPATHAVLADYFERIGQKDRAQRHRRSAQAP